MSWETTHLAKWKLPDGSIFVIEDREDDKFGGFEDPALNEDYGGNEEMYYDAMHETNTYFEKNNSGWEIIKVCHEHPNWVKSYVEYKFKSGEKLIKLNDCKKIK